MGLSTARHDSSLESCPRPLWSGGGGRRITSWVILVDHSNSTSFLFQNFNLNRIDSCSNFLRFLFKLSAILETNWITWNWWSFNKTWTLKTLLFNNFSLKWNVCCLLLVVTVVNKVTEIDKIKSTRENVKLRRINSGNLVESSGITT